MKSTLIALRLRDTELKALDDLRQSESLGDMNRSEYIRRMILTEARRRKHQGPTPENHYATEHRTGRPSK